LKIFVYILFIFIINGCEKIELIPVTSEILNKRVSKYKGEKVVLVNIWALWCKPCVEEFPMIINLPNKINDLEIIFVSVDFEDQYNSVISFLNENNAPSPYFIKQQKDEPFIEGLHIGWSGSLPFTLIYGKSSGTLVEYWEGEKTESDFVSAISKAALN